MLESRKSKKCRHKKTPSAATLEVSGVKTFEGNHEMNSNANAEDINVQPRTAQVIPFRFEAFEVRTLLVDGQPWFVASDVATALEYREAERMTRLLDDDEKGPHIVGTLGGAQKMTAINESGLYSAILRSRKPEAKRFKKWVTAEVLPAIRKHGRYEDQHGKMTTLMDELIGMSELNVIKGLIRDKAKAVPAEKRTSFQMTMHSRLHTRFNVPRTELIQAGQFAQACNFIAAYALEGEWIGPEVERSNQDRASWSNISAALHYLEMINEVNLRYDVCKSLRALGSPAGIEIYSFLHDAMGSVRAVRRHCAEQLNWQQECVA